MYDPDIAKLVTGKETHKAYFCKKCGWRSEAYVLGWAMNPKCPTCRSNLRYVCFSLDEIKRAEQMAGGKIDIVD
jgi:predicted Zn-ribbon and HTH transcriptional regulator